MTPASILFAFLALVGLGAVVFVGLKLIAHRRAAKTKAAQDNEMREHDERMTRMQKFRQEASKAAARQDRYERQTILRSVPPPARRADDTPAASPNMDNWPTYSFASSSDSPAAPAASYSGGGGSFDGGGASGDYSSSDSCSSSDSSSSSDSGSCGSGD